MLIRGMVEKELRASIDSALGGDGASMDSLFGRNMPKLMAFIRLRMGTGVSARESVADIAQSVCREVLRDMNDFEYRGDEAFRHWLFTQATRKIIDKTRYHGRAQRDIAREVQVGGESSEREAESIVQCFASFCTPSRVASGREQLEMIEAALADLPENQREAIALTKLMDVPTAEAAELIGVTDSAVRGLVARGLAKLSLILNPAT